jgi:hypothetical protein
MMAEDRRLAGRDYAWRGVRCIILRSGDIAARNTPAAGRCVRAVVTSEGIGGTGGFGGTVPLCVTSEGIGGTGGLGGVVPLGDGPGRVVAGPGSGWGAAGSGMVSSLQVGARRSVLGDRAVSGRPERCDGGRSGERLLAHAQQRRRQRPAAAAQGGRYRADPGAGTGGSRQAEPHAASLPLPSGGMTSGSARPGPSRAACGLDVAGIHRVMAAAGRDPGPAACIRHRHRQPGRGSASVMGTSDRDDRSGAHLLLR